jgi:hypothetical protein
MSTQPPGESQRKTIDRAAGSRSAVIPAASRTVRGSAVTVWTVAAIVVAARLVVLDLVSDDLDVKRRIDRQLDSTAVDLFDDHANDAADRNPLAL